MYINFQNLKQCNVAQLTVPGLMMVFLGVMILSSLMPTIVDQTIATASDLTNHSLPTESTLFSLVPLFIIVTFLATVALYGSPQ